jgi:hypothetical protein
MRKNAAIGLLVSFILLLGVSQAHGWGSATHAYIDDRIGRNGPLRNLNEIYGGMAPDVFNYLFEHPDWIEYLYMETHYEHNIILWKKAHSIFEKAVAFGFVSHNGMYGADVTAHGSYDYTLKEKPIGWVIAKAVEMAKIPEVNGLLTEFGLAENGEVTYAGYELCHTFVESAVDLLLARQDPSLGGKISDAALARTREFPDLLVTAYAEGFAAEFGLRYAKAVKTIRSAENEFRRNMVSYGLALAQQPDVAQELIVEQLVELAPAFLGAYGVALREGVTLDHMKQVSSILIDYAIRLCKADYQREVERTIHMVSKNLVHMDIYY